MVVSARALHPEAVKDDPRLRGVAVAAEAVDERDFPPHVLLAFLAVALSLLLSANLLGWMGLPYGASGGSILTKMHPATYVAVLALAAMLLREGAPVAALFRLMATEPVLCFYLAMMVVCTGFATVSTASAPTAYIESFVPAGLLAIVLWSSTARARRALAYLVTAIFVVNCGLAVVETIRQETFIPFYLDTLIEQEPGVDFRAMALYDHPLSGATLTMMGTFLLFALRLRAWAKVAIFLIYLLGMLAFGGRTALVATAGILALWGGARLVGRFVSGRLGAADLALALGGGVLLPGLVALLMAYTPFGSRIAHNFFWDESANVRTIQWSVLGLMDWHDYWFGVSFQRQTELLAQIGLQVPFEDIENFWLLLLVSLGFVGYTFFALGFLPFLASTWRRVPTVGKLLLLATILVASSSNSLGRKSNVLTILLPVSIAASGFAARRPVEAPPPVAAPRFRTRRPDALPVAPIEPTRSRWKPDAAVR